MSARPPRTLVILNLLLAACVFVFPACREATDESSAEAVSSVGPSLIDVQSPLEVQAIGHGYHWTFRYPGADGQFDTADDIQCAERFQVPADCDIRLHIRSRDYVYVFSIPALGLRQIGVPDLNYSLDFHAPTGGVFTLKSDPMCGFRLLHDDDMGEMQVTSPANFHRWLAAHDETNH